MKGGTRLMVRFASLAAALLLLGGVATSATPMTGPFAVLSARTGALDRSWPRISGFSSDDTLDVSAIVDDGHGGWFVGGGFQKVGGVVCPDLAHLTAARTLDRRFCVRPNDDVSALARTSTTLFVGGKFDQIAGTHRTLLAAFDLRTGRLETDWPQASGIPWSDNHGCCAREVRSLAILGRTLYLGGFFDDVGGLPRANLAAVDTQRRRMLDWAPRVGVQWNAVEALGAGAGSVYVAGRASGRYLVAFDPTTGSARQWDPGLNAASFAVAAGRGSVYVAGWFSRAGGARRFRVAGLDAVSGRATAWNPRLGAEVNSNCPLVETVLPAGGVVYVGGEFGQVIRGQSIVGGSLVATDSRTGRSTGWRRPTFVFDAGGGGVATLARAGNALAVGGAFVTAR